MFDKVIKGYVAVMFYNNAAHTEKFIDEYLSRYPKYAKDLRKTLATMSKPYNKFYYMRFHDGVYMGYAIGSLANILKRDGYKILKYSELITALPDDMFKL